VGESIAAPAAAFCAFYPAAARLNDDVMAAVFFPLPKIVVLTITGVAGVRI
jgi:hypothetical protein